MIQNLSRFFQFYCIFLYKINHVTLKLLQGEVSVIQKHSTADVISILDEKDRELNNAIKEYNTDNCNSNNNSNNIIKNELENFIKNQSNNNFDRFKIKAQGYKSNHKKEFDSNKNSAKNSKIFEIKKSLNLLKSNESKNDNNNIQIYKENNQKSDYNNNNIENSLYDYSKDLLHLSPSKKSITFDKVNSSYLNDINNNMGAGYVKKQ